MRTRIRELREAQHINRRELAERAGVSYDKLTKWELDKSEIGLDDAVLVAHALRCSLTELVGKDAPTRDQRFDELAGLYRSMSDEGKTALLGAARGLAAVYQGDAAVSRVGRSA